MRQTKAVLKEEIARLSTPPAGRAARPTASFAGYSALTLPVVPRT